MLFAEIHRHSQAHNEWNNESQWKSSRRLCISPILYCMWYYVLYQDRHFLTVSNYIYVDVDDIGDLSCVDKMPTELTNEEMLNKLWGQYYFYCNFVDILYRALETLVLLLLLLFVFIFAYPCVISNNLSMNNFFRTC